VKVDNSRFFMVGAVGFLCGFFAWSWWLLLTISELLRAVLARFFHYYGFWGATYSSGMGGIFFQNRVFSMIFLGLLILSLALGSFGCFAFKRKYSSNLAFVCGILFLVLSTVLISIPFIPGTLLWFIFRSPPIILSVGLFVLGVTLLSIRKSLPNHKKESCSRTGLLFIAVSVFSFIPTLMPVIMYWGFEVWLLFIGWLYAINCIATARLMLQMHAYPDQSTQNHLLGLS
jgi:hypothetical protein